MTPNDQPKKIANAPQQATRVSTPPVDAAKDAASEPGPDSLKTQMPSGELGVRNLPGDVLSTASGGTSKAEDTTRAAGYVADLTKSNEPPPGPPIAKEPSNYAGPEATTPPPVDRASVARAPGPTPPLPDPAGIDPAPRSDPSKSPNPAERRDPPPPTPANPIERPLREPPNPADPVKNPAHVEV